MGKVSAGPGVGWEAGVPCRVQAPPPSPASNAVCPSPAQLLAGMQTFREHNYSPEAMCHRLLKRRSSGMATHKPALARALARQGPSCNAQRHRAAADGKFLAGSKTLALKRNDPFFMGWAHRG